jgi:hypothetical protein
MSMMDSYSLPDGASWLDRATLWVWRWWSNWAGPVLLAACIMTACHLLVALLSGISLTGTSFNSWRLLVRWGSQPAYPIGTPGVSGVARIGAPVTPATDGLILAWSIGIQVVACLLGALAAGIAMRHKRRPGSIGFLGGLLATAVHLTVAAFWTSTPLPGAAPLVNGAGLTALWLYPILGLFFGWLLGVDRKHSVTQGDE